jgi:Holliday junction DNA helicase RuvA
MIALLSGILKQIDIQNVILDVNGVGYQTFITARTQSALGGVGTPATLHIVTQVREDAITLFGFAQREEKDTFLKLTTVQGVGAKMALSLLSTLTPEQLWRAIVSDDKKMLSSADGVGPKLAARLATELKDYAGKQIFPSAPSKTKTAPAMHGVFNEAISALVALGYSPSDAMRAVSMVANENDDRDISTLIKLALREVSA